jgi:hypothetical protein
MRPYLFALIFLIIPAAAHADTLQTTLSGDGNTIIFPLFGGDIGGTYFPRGFEFQSSPLNAIINGTPGFAGISFFDPTQNNGVDFEVFGTTAGGIFDGPNLLSPFSFDSVLSPGVYNLTLASNGDPYTLTVGPTPSLTPEPATWLLLSTGLTGALSLFRRRPSPSR